MLQDNECIGRLAAEHFLERGFRHIAFFNFGNWWMETERMPAFAQAIRLAGAQFHEIPYYQHFSRQPATAATLEPAAHRWLVELIRNLPKPVGIFAATDDLALDLLRACGAAGMSRRALERAFLKHLNRTVAEEITRLRVDHAKELLLKPDIKIYQVAAQSGFANGMYFSKVFQQSSPLP